MRKRFITKGGNIFSINQLKEELEMSKRIVIGNYRFHVRDASAVRAFNFENIVERIDAMGYSAEIQHAKKVLDKE